MAYSSSSGWQLPAGAFNPAPDSSTLALNLVIVGAYIASSAISSAVSPLPPIVEMSEIYIQYAFRVVLLLILMFGIGMVGIGWLVGSNTIRYVAAGRGMARASHFVLVFVIAFHGAASTSATSAHLIKK